MREIGQRLALAAPSETTIGNIIRRVLHIIREEVQNGDKALADGTPQFPPQTIMPLDAQQPASPSPLRQDTLVGSGAGTGTTTTSEPLQEHGASWCPIFVQIRCGI
ncbi:hypothetical protein CAOG_05438 [Capsaspora owczarzaki ATCC 30864]|uniref:Uncharacterized protein n=1 Tax=Capsaspora owczarzaki (strain ATCC 30864) TaxID=595528 RepID=A0A0D2WTB9_CAPO3|nr:hypothetical protein CAOG_05438 [Capsaspora owczarzaki ATCC 30864]KJE94878.1 hypothetical protein CAOG_005438 [Capsaspora owczarzaki ATCC 30864]|eukprot:XP_004346111.1 hypothetical protein CAOG_05438 [Capsaspora owczarzaki ATCC 30864]